MSDQVTQVKVVLKGEDQLSPVVDKAVARTEKRLDQTSRRTVRTGEDQAARDLAAARLRGDRSRQRREAMNRQADAIVAERQNRRLSRSAVAGATDTGMMYGPELSPSRTEQRRKAEQEARAGTLGSLKKTFGEGSFAMNAAGLLRGAGPIAAVGIGGAVAASAVKDARELVDAYRRGEISASQMRAQLADTIPVVRQIKGFVSDTFQLITGESARQAIKDLGTEAYRAGERARKAAESWREETRRTVTRSDEQNRRMGMSDPQRARAEAQDRYSESVSQADERRSRRLGSDEMTALRARYQDMRVQAGRADWNTREGQDAIRQRNALRAQVEQREAEAAKLRQDEVDAAARQRAVETGRTVFDQARERLQSFGSRLRGAYQGFEQRSQERREGRNRRAEAERENADEVARIRREARETQLRDQGQAADAEMEALRADFARQRDEVARGVEAVERERGKASQDAIQARRLAGEKLKALEENEAAQSASLLKSRLDNERRIREQHESSIVATGTQATSRRLQTAGRTLEAERLQLQEGLRQRLEEINRARDEEIRQGGNADAANRRAGESAAAARDLFDAENEAMRNRRGGFDINRGNIASGGRLGARLTTSEIQTPMRSTQSDATTKAINEGNKRLEAALQKQADAIGRQFAAALREVIAPTAG